MNEDSLDRIFCIVTVLMACCGGIYYVADALSQHSEETFNETMTILDYRIETNDSDPYLTEAIRSLKQTNDTSWEIFGGMVLLCIGLLFFMALPTISKPTLEKRMSVIEDEIKEFKESLKDDSPKLSR